MAGRPILFSGPMIRALMEGRKTQTRRVLKPQPVARVVRPNGFFGATSFFLFTLCDDGGANSSMAVPIPYAAGDRLWVREAFTTTQHDKAVYRADATDQTGQRWHSIEPGDPKKEVLWRPSIFMPRWASRLTLIVTDVRVQRLQEISDEDALAEGVDVAINPRAGQDIDIDGQYWPGGPKRMFRDLWNSLNDKRGYGWTANPWVCALTFTVRQRNIDQMEGQQ